MLNQNQFLLDSGFWGWLYKLLTPIEWLMTQIMAIFHKFLTLLGMHPVGFSWVLSIIFLVLVVHAYTIYVYGKIIKNSMEGIKDTMNWFINLN